MSCGLFVRFIHIDQTWINKVRFRSVMDGFQEKENKISIRSYSRLIFVLMLCFILTSCNDRALVSNSIKYEREKITKGSDDYGSFYYYLPKNLSENSEVLVLVHGTPIDLTPEENAEFYITSWVGFAEEYNYLLIAPAFNQENFSSRYGDRAMGGYRGLFGREIGADEWVLQLVDSFKRNTGIPGGQFSLYGHSAGGQFVGRFLVTHPEVVKSAVITSAATYPQPDKEVNWPFGLGELHTDIEWDESTIKHVDIVPDQEKWLLATKIPLTVIVGLNDTTEIAQEFLIGQKGKNRIMIAQNWIKDMETFSELNGVESHFKLELIPGVGHSMSGLIPYSQQAILP